MDILNGYFFLKVTRQFRMYTYRIRGKRGPFKIILPASFCSFLTLPGMSGSPPSFSDYLYFYSFMDRNVHAHFYRQSDHYWRYPLNERILSGIVHFLFFGKMFFFRGFSFAVKISTPKIFSLGFPKICSDLMFIKRFSFELLLYGSLSQVFFPFGSLSS